MTIEAPITKVCFLQRAPRGKKNTIMSVCVFELYHNQVTPNNDFRVLEILVSSVRFNGRSRLRLLAGWPRGVWPDQKEANHLRPPPQLTISHCILYASCAFKQLKVTNAPCGRKLLGGAVFPHQPLSGFTCRILKRRSKSGTKDPFTVSRIFFFFFAAHPHHHSAQR